MRLIIFGATGNIGQQLILQSLVLDHTVTAFTRNGKKLKDFDHENLIVYEGDVFDNRAVEHAVKGNDVVICTLGAGRRGIIRSEGTYNIIDAMKQTGVKRLIVQSTLGVGDSRKNLNFFWKYIMFGWFLKDAYQDHQIQEKYVKDSGLDWTIVRPGAFTDGKATGNYKHGFPPDDKSIKLKISKADVAMFILLQLNSDEYLHKTPGLSY